MNIYRVQLKVEKLYWLKFSTINKIKLMKQILKDIFKEVKSQPTIILFPAGIFNFSVLQEICIKKLARFFSKFLEINHSSAVIVLGIDFGVKKDITKIKKAKKQMAIAINKDGIIALSKKFYPTKEEEGKIELSSSPYEKTCGLNACFTYNNQPFVMAVCYDIFGIRKKNIKVEKNTIILNLIHTFKKTGIASGTFYYVRDGLARTSYYTSCKVFCAAIFEEKEFGNYISGIYVDNEVLNTWKYNDNKQNSKSSQKQYSKVLVRVDKSFV